MSPKILTPDYKILNGQVNVRLDPEQKTAFLKRCRKLKMKHSTVLRSLIDDFIQAHPLHSGESMLHCVHGKEDAENKTKTGEPENERAKNRGHGEAEGGPVSKSR